MRKLLSLLFSLFLVILAASCDDFDSWTTSPSAQLTFSADTVRFDTVITRHSSTTRTLIVFNPADKGVRIRSIALGQGSQSMFRVNVDGEYLASGAGEDFEIRGKDSIYIRAEVTLPASGSAEIRDFEDELRFTLESGVSQKVILTASGMDVVEHRGLVIERDTLLADDRPFHIYDSLYVAPGAILTLAPGTTLMFHDGVELLVHGTLKARGTVDQPVTFRGDRTDRLFPYLPYDNTPNRWGGIHIYPESRANELIQCDIHSGDYGLQVDSTDVEDLSLYMENSIIHNVGGHGLRLTNCQTQILGTQISNTLGTSVWINGGAHTFLHCTIAQFYPWSANRGDALFITNMQDDVYYHLHWCEFLNSIITGYAEDVIMGNIAENDEYKCDYLFSHSLLRTVVSDDEQRFVSVKYDIKDSTEVLGKDNFRLFDTDNFLYDFTPDSLSQARGLANPIMVEFIPFDRLGRSRLADNNPDAGALEL